MQIDHLAIRVDDLDAAGKFYEEVLGFTAVRQGYNRDHFSRHLTDGRIDIALVRYDRDATSRESQVGGGPCIHHFGVSVEDVATWTDRIEALGCEIISKPGVVPVKFVAPGGVVMEIAPNGHFDLTPR